MEQVFDLKTGNIAIGDPTMGLVQYPLKRPAGAYSLEKGALSDESSDSDDAPCISLDSPGIFVMDSSVAEAFTEWYHRVGNECSYMMLTIIERLPELQSAIGARVAFYWESEVGGEYREGEYTFDSSKVVAAGKAKPKASKSPRANGRTKRSS